MFSGLLQKDLFKGSWSLTESFCKQNYCHACHSRFAVLFPLPSCCVIISSLIVNFLIFDSSWETSASRERNSTVSLLIFDLEFNSKYTSKKKNCSRALATRARSPKAKKIWLSIHPRNFCRHVTLRPSDRPFTSPSSPQGNECEISHILASVGACNLKWHIHIVVNCWQLSKQGIRWPVSRDHIKGSGIDPSRFCVFVLKLSADKFLVFNWSQAQPQVDSGVLS